MTLVTRQNLLAEKTRFLISVAGIALSVFLISLLLSLFQGWSLNVGRFVERVDADVWVMREGTSDFINAASILSGETAETLADVPGVRRVDSMIVRPMEFEVGGERYNTHLVGYELDGGSGGPLNIIEGKEAPGAGEIILDSAFAKRAGVGVGDVLQFGDHRLEVAAISTGGNLVFSQTTYVSLETAREILSMDGLATFYLLRVDEDADAEAVAAEAMRGDATLSAFTRAEFTSATRARIMSNVIPILVVVLVIALVVGVSITGLTIYNATVENEREFGILKALGFTNGYLYRLVVEQSLATGLLGFVVGVGLTVIGAQFISGLVPQFVTLVRWQDVMIVLGLTLLMSGCAALMPVRRIAGVDPVFVFKA